MAKLAAASDLGSDAVRCESSSLSWGTYTAVVKGTRAPLVDSLDTAFSEAGIGKPNHAGASTVCCTNLTIVINKNTIRVLG